MLRKAVREEDDQNHYKVPAPDSKVVVDGAVVVAANSVAARPACAGEESDECDG